MILLCYSVLNNWWITKSQFNWKNAFKQRKWIMAGYGPEIRSKELFWLHLLKYCAESTIKKLLSFPVCEWFNENVGIGNRKDL